MSCHHRRRRYTLFYRNNRQKPLQCPSHLTVLERGFTPDTGRIIAYREPQGFGIRLDGANGYAGSEISVCFAI